MPKISIGDTIYLSDKITLKKSITESGMQTSVVTEVKSSQHLTVEDVGSWDLYELASEFGPLYLLYKTIDNETDVRIYELQDFVNGNRQDLLKKDMYWLFNKPADPDNFSGNESNHLKALTFVEEIYNEENGKRTTWVKKPQRLLNGLSNYSYMDDQVTSLVEYISQEPTDYSELLILEDGDTKYGGYVRLFKGYPINQAEVEIFSK